MRILVAIFLIVSFLFEVTSVQAQAKKKKFPRNINMLGYDNFGPAISGDGNVMVYLSNYTNEGTTAFMFTEKENASAWKDPEELPRVVNIPHLTYIHGYCLNFDGSEFYFTFKKSGGLGGYDLWIVKRQGSGWGAAQNLGSPINSSLHDGSPSISSDGKSLYFMSCETMSNETASSCKIKVSTRMNSRSKWRAPEPLSDVINQSNAMSPNILADEETLMYLSDHEGSPQWYISRIEDGNWAAPQKMDFINFNSEHNISIAAKGRYLYHDIQGERGVKIEGLLIPDEFKPKDVLRVIGTVDSSVGGTMKVYDVDSRERIVFEKLSAGQSYDFVLKEGKVYDVSFSSEDLQSLSPSALFDLIEMRFSTRQKWNVSPITLEAGDSLEMKTMLLDTLKVGVADQSVYEFRRLTRFLTKSESQYEINIIHYPLDTAQVVIPEIEIDSMQYDEYMDEEHYAETDPTITYDQMDSLEMEVVDSTMVEEELIPVVPTMAENLATALSESLISKKVPEEKVIVNGITIPIKELEGNEDVADRIVVYLKKRND